MFSLTFLFGDPVTISGAQVFWSFCTVDFSRLIYIHIVSDVGLMGVRLFRVLADAGSRNLVRYTKPQEPRLDFS